MHIFVINLSSAKENYKRTLNELKKMKTDKDKIYRFEAIDGKRVDRANSEIYPICKIFCTDKMIGIGLSHIYLCKELVAYKLDYALVLEDDIKIVNSNTSTHIMRIIDIMNRKDPNWDFILLHRQGFISEPYNRVNGMLQGSSAAYIISYRGMQKVASLRLNYHYDFDRNSFYFRTYNGPHLIDTYEDPILGNDYTRRILNIRLKGKTIHFWANQPVAREPLTNRIIHLYDICLILILLLVLSIYKSMYSTLRIFNLLFCILWTLIALLCIWGITSLTIKHIAVRDFKSTRSIFLTNT